MSILFNHIEKMDEIKESIKEDSDKILNAINLNDLFELDKKGIQDYITNILMDYWESRDDLLNKSIKLGEKKAKDLIKAST